MAHPSWGAGWPNCQTNRLKTVVLSNGIKLPVRAELAELIGLLCEETMRRGYRLVPGWCWGFACRPIANTRTPSNHSWGLAVDLNAPKNPYTTRLVTDMPSWMPAMWKSYGFRWGGDYRGKKDAMHYEFMGSVADARTQTERARRELGGAKASEVASAMRIKPEDLQRQFEAARQRWPFFEDLERRNDLPRFLLFALGSRETNLDPAYADGKTGDGGHGHGVFQLDDRWHKIPPGFGRDIRAQANRAVVELTSWYRKHGDWLKALNAYNSGSPLTERTTGKDYGPDVLARMEFLQVNYQEEEDDEMRGKLVAAKHPHGGEEIWYVWRGPEGLLRRNVNNPTAIIAHFKAGVTDSQVLPDGSVSTEDWSWDQLQVARAVE